MIISNIVGSTIFTVTIYIPYLKVLTSYFNTRLLISRKLGISRTLLAGTILIHNLSKGANGVTARFAILTCSLIRWTCFAFTLINTISHNERIASTNVTNTFPTLMRSCVWWTNFAYSFLSNNFIQLTLWTTATSLILGYNLIGLTFSTISINCHVFILLITDWSLTT